MDNHRLRSIDGARRDRSHSHKRFRSKEQAARYEGRPRCNHVTCSRNALGTRSMGQLGYLCTTSSSCGLLNSAPAGMLAEAGLHVSVNFCRCIYAIAIAMARPCYSLRSCLYLPVLVAASFPTSIRFAIACIACAQDPSSPTSPLRRASASIRSLDYAYSYRSRRCNRTFQ
jgi:hypothetical protein